MNIQTAYSNFTKGTTECPHFAVISSSYVEALMIDQFLVQEVTLNVLELNFESEQALGPNL
jgi:hypothetical protein